MVARRIGTALAVLFIALLGAGCAETVEGNGKADEAAVALGGGGDDNPSDSPSEEPSESSSSEEPSSEPSTDDTDTGTTTGGGGSGGGGGSSDPSSVCGSIDKAKTQQLFGTSVTYEDSGSTGCQLEASDGRSMIVAVYSALTLAEYKAKETPNTPLTISGHPAIKTSSTIIYAARSTNAAQAGMVAAYYAGLGGTSAGDQIAVGMITQLLEKFGN